MCRRARFYRVKRRKAKKTRRCKKKLLMLNFPNLFSSEAIVTFSRHNQRLIIKKKVITLFDSERPFIAPTLQFFFFFFKFAACRDAVFINVAFVRAATLWRLALVFFLWQYCFFLSRSRRPKRAKHRFSRASCLQTKVRFKERYWPPLTMGHLTPHILEFRLRNRQPATTDSEWVAFFWDKNLWGKISANVEIFYESLMIM